MELLQPAYEKCIITLFTDEEKFKHLHQIHTVTWLGQDWNPDLPVFNAPSTSLHCETLMSDQQILLPQV